MDLEKKWHKTVLIYCGLISSIFYISTDLLASFSYTGYSIIDQNYSELLATGAPTRQLMILACVIYNFLVVSFALGVMSLDKQKHKALITGLLMLGYAIFSLTTPLFFQMDMRGAEITKHGALHPLMTAIMSLFLLLSMGFGAFVLSKKFRIYTFTTIVILLIFGGLTGLQASKLETGLPTPFMGLTERINIYATMLWFSVFSIILLKSIRNHDTPINK